MDKRTPLLLNWLQEYSAFGIRTTLLHFCRSPVSTYTKACREQEQVLSHVVSILFQTRQKSNLNQNQGSWQAEGKAQGEHAKVSVRPGSVATSKRLTLTENSLIMTPRYQITSDTTNGFVCVLPRPKNLPCTTLPLWSLPCSRR